MKEKYSYQSVIFRKKRNKKKSTHNSFTNDNIPIEDLFILQKEEIQKIKNIQNQQKPKEEKKFLNHKLENYLKSIPNFYPKDTHPTKKDKEQIDKNKKINISTIKQSKSQEKINDIQKNKASQEQENNIHNNDTRNNDNLNKDIDLNKFQMCECLGSQNDDDGDYSDEDSDYNNEDILPNFGNIWENFEKITENLFKGCNIGNKVIKTNNYINYNSSGVEINLHVNLYSQSSFWIFTRCFVDDNPDMENNMFSRYSTVIKIYKESHSNKSFICFGTFYPSQKNEQLHYKSFLKRQLIDYLHDDSNYYYLENDLCSFDIIITDLGNENIDAKVAVNNNTKFNEIKSQFFLPINNKAKIMFCGEGKNVSVSFLKIREIKKSEIENETGKKNFLLYESQKSCDCCNIF